MFREHVICFHNPDEENGYLSNWYASSFMVDEKLFSSMEQFMMYRKAICFHDTDIASKILDRHKIIGDFFVAIGVDESVATEDACRIEHVISDDTFDALKKYFTK